MRRISITAPWLISVLLVLLATSVRPLWAATQDTAYVQRIPGTTVTLRMMPVPAGAVQTPSPAGQQAGVAPFWIAETEIPWDLYDVWVFGLGQPSGGEVVSRPTRPYVLPGEEFGHEGRPAIGISFHAATEFARWLSRQSGQTYRLATETEWEHACRLGLAGTGDEPGVWHRGNANDRTQPVDASRPDGLGVRDMRGNVAEWVVGRDGDPVAKGGAFTDRLDTIDCVVSRKQTPSWNATDPQLPRSRWWLPDAVFVGFRVVRER